MAAEITVTIEVRAGYEKVAGVSTTRDVAGIPADTMYRSLDPQAFRILQDALAPEVAAALDAAVVQIETRVHEAEDRAQERAL